MGRLRRVFKISLTVTAELGLKPRAVCLYGHCLSCLSWLLLGTSSPWPHAPEQMPQEFQILPIFQSARTPWGSVEEAFIGEKEAEFSSSLFCWSSCWRPESQMEAAVLLGLRPPKPSSHKPPNSPLFGSSLS